MSKVTVTHVSNLIGNPTSAATTLNNNLDAIQTALENTLSRDGTSPNQMTSELDMNSNRIINLPAPTSNNEPARHGDLQTYVDEAAASEAAAAASATSAGESATAAATSASEAAASAASIITNALPPAATSAMRDFKQELGMPLSFTDYGLVPNDSSTAVQTANVDAFNTLVADMRTRGVGRCFVPNGSWSVNSALTVDWGLLFYGQHMSTSIIAPSHTDFAVYFTGANGTGGGLEDLSIDFVTGGGTSVGHINASASVGGTSPDFLRLQRLNLTGFDNSLVIYGIILDGNSRDGSAPNGLVGIRDILIRDIWSFNKNGGHNLDVRYGHGIVINNFQTFQASSPTNTSLNFSGASAAQATAGLYASQLTANTMSFDKISQFTVMGAYAFTSCTISSDASAGLLAVTGGTVSNSGTGVTVLS